MKVVPKRTYTPEVRDAAVEQVLEGGRSIASVNDQQIARVEGTFRNQPSDRERSGRLVEAADRFVARGGTWERCPRVRVVR